MWLLVSRAREWEAAARRHCLKPGETRANPGTALLELGSELSNKKSRYLTSVILNKLLDTMNYSLTHRDIANPGTQFSDFTHLNP